MSPEDRQIYNQRKASDLVKRKTAWHKSFAFLPRRILLNKSGDSKVIWLKSYYRKYVLVETVKSRRTDTSDVRYTYGVRFKLDAERLCEADIVAEALASDTTGYWNQTDLDDENAIRRLWKPKVTVSNIFGEDILDE